MMISDNLNLYDYGGYTKMTAPSSDVNSTDKDESKRIIVQETLSHNCSANNDELKKIIVNKNLSQDYSAGVEKLCLIEIDKSEYTHVPGFNVSNVF